MQASRLFFLLISFTALTTFAIAQESLTDEGFPADWTADDFAPTGEEPTGTEALGMDERDEGTPQIAPYGAAPIAPALRLSVQSNGNITSATGLGSFRIEQLPTIAISSTEETSASAVSGTITSTTPVATIPLSEAFPSTPATNRTRIKGEDLDAPDTIGSSALGAYGVIQRNFQWGNVRGIQNGWDNAIRRVQPVTETAEETALTRSALRRALAAALASAVPAPEGTLPEDWLAWRMERLMELGNADLAWQLARPITPIARERNANLRRAWAEVSLLVGDVPNACTALKTEASSEADQPNGGVLPYWRQAVMVCQALERGRDGLGLSLAAATADGLAFPPLLQTLLQTVAENGPAPKVPQNSRAGVLEAALYAAYPALIQDEVWPMLPNVVLWRLVRTEALPLALRTQAAEWLTAQDMDNLVPNAPQTSAADALSQLYGLFNFTSEQKDNPVQHGASLSPVMQRALYWQVGSTGNITAWNAWQKATKSAGLMALAATMPVPAGLTTQTADPAPLLLATRQAIRAGNLTEAKAQFDKLRTAEGLSLPNLRARAALGALLATLQKSDPTVWLTQWQVALPVGTVAGKQAALSQMALWVELGTPLDDTTRASILTRVGEVPGGAQWPLWQPLVLDALAEGKTASALAQVASAMPEADGIVPGWVQPALRTLSAVGDEDARRRLALALALSGVNEDAETPKPAPVQQTPTISSATTPLNTVSATVNTSATLPSSVLFQFMQGTSPTADGSPDWLLPPPRVPAPTPPKKPYAPSI